MLNAPNLRHHVLLLQEEHNQKCQRVSVEVCALQSLAFQPRLDELNQLAGFWLDHEEVTEDLRFAHLEAILDGDSA